MMHKSCGTTVGCVLELALHRNCEMTAECVPEEVALHYLRNSCQAIAAWAELALHHDA